MRLDMIITECWIEGEIFYKKCNWFRKLARRNRWIKILFLSPFQHHQGIRRRRRKIL